MGQVSWVGVGMDETRRPRHRGAPEVAPTSDPASDPASEPSAESRFSVIHHPDGAVSVLFAPQPTASTQISGVQRAVVVSTVDPLERGRVEIILPLVGDPPLWAESCLAPGDKSEPDVGEQVWVSFEEGDPHRPVWLGLVRG